MFKFGEIYFEHKAKASANVESRKWEGLRIVLKLVWWKLFWWIPLELATTFWAYLPASDYHLKICKSINSKWDKLTVKQQDAVLDFLIWLDAKGEISKILVSNK